MAAQTCEIVAQADFCLPTSLPMQRSHRKGLEQPLHSPRPMPSAPSAASSLTLDEPPTQLTARRLKVGILANEVFATDVGRMGGFGWAVQQVSRCFSNVESPGVDPVILMGERVQSGEPLTPHLHGSRVIWPSSSLWKWARRIQRERIDLLLSIDFRPNYRFFYTLLPRTPILLWVRDPWDDEDRAIIAKLRVPGDHTPPQGVSPPRTRTLSGMFQLSRLTGRSMMIAVTTPSLAPKIESTYGVHASEVFVLPNIVEPPIGPVRKSERPVVAFLARLDPVKRPWLLMTLAARMPEIDFVVMGQSHFRGAGSWQPGELPRNVRLVGHANEPTKRAVLESAWILLNTSIHEGLSVSFLEALAYETPVVSSVNPENLVRRFGEWVGRFPGVGEDGLDRFEAALRKLIGDGVRRARLGAEGRRWVESTHCRSEFLQSFNRICSKAMFQREAL